MSENSRIDDKIKRDTLMRDELENLWDSLDMRVKEASKKLNDHFQAGIKTWLNDNNSAIRVRGETVHLGGGEASTPELEIRIERRIFKPSILVRRIDNHTHAKEYPIKADLSSNSLRFVNKDMLLTPLMFAEMLLAEFTEVDLDS